MMSFQNDQEFAQAQDRKDRLAAFRHQFHLPRMKDGTHMIYFTGNSLGLQPQNTRSFIEQELSDWEKQGVEGHFHGKNPWYYYHHFLMETAAEIVGAKKEEVVHMNSLTTNLHILMTSFYRPTSERSLILIEQGAFPSDKYAMDSQASLHGFDPDTTVVQLKPKEGKETLETEDILKTIEELGDRLALVMLGGVNYYTGQYFNLKAITEKAHEVGAIAGYDLAHAAGNVGVHLHDWQVDFACWCSYKYLNSGPGGVSGIFVHEKHGNNPDLLRMAGWWGNDEKTRFNMPEKFVPQAGAAGWQLSNAPVLPMAAHWAALDIFKQAGFSNLIEKSKKLTSYLEYLIQDINQRMGRVVYEIITPSDPDQRGAQLSIIAREGGKSIHEAITAKGVVADWREPNVIRVAPVPLYNRFEEVWQFARTLESQVKAI